MGMPDFRAMRQQVEQMRAQKTATFPVDSLVQVESERFHGIGIVALDESCPLEKLAVRVESQNVWWYPIEDCKPYNGRMPTWIRSFNRSRQRGRVRVTKTLASE